MEKQKGTYLAKKNQKMKELKENLREAFKYLYMAEDSKEKNDVEEAMKIFGKMKDVAETEKGRYVYKKMDDFVKGRFEGAESVRKLTIEMIIKEFYDFCYLYLGIKYELDSQGRVILDAEL